MLCPSYQANDSLDTLTNAELTTLQANINEEASKLVSDAVRARHFAILAVGPPCFNDAPQILLSTLLRFERLERAILQ